MCGARRKFRPESPDDARGESLAISTFVDGEQGFTSQEPIKSLEFNMFSSTLIGASFEPRRSQEKVLKLRKGSELPSDLPASSRCKFEYK